jgi:DNA repair protein RadC
MNRKHQGELGLSFMCYIPFVRDSGKCIRTPVDTVAEMEEIRNLSQEVFGVLYLNARNCLLDKKIVCVGIADACLVHPREVFRQAIISQASCIVLCHNHPTGSSMPSAEDVQLTRQLIDSGVIIGIKVLDHVIIGRGTPDNVRNFVSLREGGLCEFKKISTARQTLLWQICLNARPFSTA